MGFDSCRDGLRGLGGVAAQGDGPLRDEIGELAGVGCHFIEELMECDEVGAP